MSQRISTIVANRLISCCFLWLRRPCFTTWAVRSRYVVVLHPLPIPPRGGGGSRTIILEYSRSYSNLAAARGARTCQAGKPDLQFLHPDLAELGWVAVVLEADGAGLGKVGEFGFVDDALAVGVDASCGCL